MIPLAHLHPSQKNKQSEVRARANQVHAVRCTSRHRNREDRILPRTKIGWMKKTSRPRKIEKQSRKIKKGREKGKKSIEARKKQGRTDN